MKKVLLISVLSVAAAGFLLWNGCGDDKSSGPDDGDDWSEYCEVQPLPAPTGNIVNVSNVSELLDAVAAANSSGSWTILVEPGTYQLSAAFLVTGDNVTIRGSTGDREDVVIRGEGMMTGPNNLIQVDADDFTIADLTLGWAYANALLIYHDSDNALVHNVRFVDMGEHFIKVNYLTASSNRTDNGEVRWCVFVYTDGMGPQSNIGGIYARQAESWIVHHNIFYGIASGDAGSTGFAVCFLDDSANTIVENNKIYECDRGIAFGLGNDPIEHVGGYIRNNMVSTIGDVSISLQSAESASVYNNTVYTQNYTNSIEYRFTGTIMASIINNLTNMPITARDGGTGVLETNYTAAEHSWFFHPATGDLHLAAEQPEVVDQGTPLTSIPFDFDCEERPMGDGYDIGADEY